MIVSGREIVKFAIFVALVAAVVYFVAVNREHLMENLSWGGAGEEAAGADNLSGGAESAGLGGQATTGSPAGSGDGSVLSGDVATEGEVLPVAAFSGAAGSSGGGAAAGGAGSAALGAAFPADDQAAGVDLFVEYRLDREEARSEQLDLLREVIDNQGIDKSSRDEAMKLWLSITDSISKEVDIENLIRAKGFEDAVVILSEGKATVMVKAASLTPEEALMVADLARRISGLSFENITVMAKGG